MLISRLAAYFFWDASHFVFHFYWLSNGPCCKNNVADSVNSCMNVFVSEEGRMVVCMCQWTVFINLPLVAVKLMQKSCPCNLHFGSRAMNSNEILCTAANRTLWYYFMLQCLNYVTWKKWKYCCSSWIPLWQVLQSQFIVCFKRINIELTLWLEATRFIEWKMLMS